MASDEIFEHFPELKKYATEDENGKQILRGTFEFIGDPNEEEVAALFLGLGEADKRKRAEFLADAIKDSMHLDRLREVLLNLGVAHQINEIGITTHQTLLSDAIEHFQEQKKNGRRQFANKHLLD